MHSRMLAMTTIVALVALVACSSDPVSGPGAPATLAVVSGGTNATGRVILQSTDRIDTVVVRVTDAQGRAVPDVTVTWTTDDPDAVVTPLTALSDAEGLVRAEWRLSGAPGTWKARASAGTLTAAETSFTVTSWSVKNAVVVLTTTCVQSHDDRLWCRESDTAPFTAQLGGGTIRALDGTEGQTDRDRVICAVDGGGVVHCAIVTSGAFEFTAIPGQDRPFRSLALGTRHTNCALATDGSLYCWGAGYLGDGTASGEYRNAMGPVSAPDGTVFMAAAVGAMNACALDETGTPWCWGYHGAAVAGASVPEEVRMPRAVSVPVPLQSITMPDHAAAVCGLDATNRAICWGVGYALGLDAAVAPAPLPGATGLRQIASLGDGFIAVTIDGGLRGWGSHRQGMMEFPGAVSDLPRGQAIGGVGLYRSRASLRRVCLDTQGARGTVCASEHDLANTASSPWMQSPFGTGHWTGFVKPAGAN